MNNDAAAVWMRYNDAENAHSFEQMAALLHADLYVEVNGRAALSSAKEDTAAMSARIALYPDYKREMLSAVRDGRTAAIRWRMTGTPSLASTEEVLDVAGCSFVETSGGLLRRAFLYY
jgi:hypothetical protein